MLTTNTSSPFVVTKANAVNVPTTYDTSSECASACASIASQTFAVMTLADM